MPDSGRLPVSGIMWPEAFAYCAARDPGTRLPTELEWEAAARGREGRDYPWGNAWLPRHANANNDASAHIAVATYAAGVSPYQVFDMVGNVWEWTSTPAAPDAAGRRQYIIRGGAFNTDSSMATTTLRAPFAEMSGAPNQRENYRNTGFRCAWSPLR
jgi:formylglycine-generating enzyme required for sulfatase activity